MIIKFIPLIFFRIYNDEMFHEINKNKIINGLSANLINQKFADIQCLKIFTPIKKKI